jgi:hypothetical protein
LSLSDATTYYLTKAAASATYVTSSYLSANYYTSTYINTNFVSISSFDTVIPSYNTFTCTPVANGSMPNSTSIQMYLTHSRGLTMILVSSVTWTGITTGSKTITIPFPSSCFSLFNKLGNFAGQYILDDSTAGTSTSCRWEWQSGSYGGGSTEALVLYPDLKNSNVFTNHNYAFANFSISYQSTI